MVAWELMLLLDCGRGPRQGGHEGQELLWGVHCIWGVHSSRLLDSSSSAIPGWQGRIMRRGCGSSTASSTCGHPGPRSSWKGAQSASGDSGMISARMTSELPSIHLCCHHPRVPEFGLTPQFCFTAKGVLVKARSTVCIEESWRATLQCCCC